MRLDGTALASRHARERARAIGYLPQTAEIAWDLSLRNLVALGRLPHGDGGEAAIDAALAALDLAELASRPVSTLSGGERARALLARVLAGEPRWVLADEPLAALDLGHQLALVAHLRQAACEGAGVVMVLHDLGLAMNHADRVLVLANGYLAADDLPEAALQPALIERVFVPAVIGNPAPVGQEVSKVAAIWAVQGALLVGIVSVIAFAWKPVFASFAEGTKSAIGGALLASMNTASEYGFGAVIAALPGFLVVANALQAIPNPLVNEAISVTALAGITGSASGGMSIALAAMADQFITAANAAGIPMEVLHRIASMASGGMDTLPHNGAVITLLGVTGLTHRQSYGDIFAVTCIKTLAVFFVIAVYYLTGIV